MTSDSLRPKRDAAARHPSLREGIPENKEKKMGTKFTATMEHDDESAARSQNVRPVPMLFLAHGCGAVR